MTPQDQIGPEFLAFLSTLPSALQTRIHILTDSDADGLPAAAILVRALRLAGYTALTAEVRLKTESAWTPVVLDRLSAREPQALLVLDLGARPEPLLPGIPTLLLDHHKPLGTPPGATLISAYRETAPGEDAKEIPTTGLMAYRCAQGLIPDRAESLLWLAAVSLLSDLGDKAPFPELAAAKKLFGGGALRDLTSLLNAPRRSALGDASAALDLLLLADSPKQALTSTAPEIAALREQLLTAKAEVGEALALARKLPPRFSTAVRDELGADLVAIRMETPCQVHPLVAQQWRARFPKSVIFGVNTGFRPGWVHFSGRSPRRRQPHPLPPRPSAARSGRRLRQRSRSGRWRGPSHRRLEPLRHSNRLRPGDAGLSEPCASPHNSVIPTEAQRSGGTCFSPAPTTQLWHPDRSAAQWRDLLLTHHRILESSGHLIHRLPPSNPERTYL